MDALSFRNIFVFFARDNLRTVTSLSVAHAWTHVVDAKDANLNSGEKLPLLVL